MIKTSLLAVLLIAVSGQAQAVKDVELCQKLAYIAGVGANARDSGVRQSDFYADVKKALDSNKETYDQKTRDAFVFFFTIAYALPETDRENIEREVFARCVE